MKFIKKYVFIICCLIVSAFNGSVYAQETLAEISIDSAAILIGEQTTLHLKVTTSPESQAIIAIPRDTLMQGVEVLNISKGDSSIQDNRLIIKQDILITSFDSALYLLPPIKVINREDTVLSNQVALKVSTVPVNVDKPEEFNDIKNVWKAPFVLADYYSLILGILLALLLIALIYYLIKQFKKRKNANGTEVKSEPLLPPYEQAISELDSIKQRKLWQQGLNKEYYSMLTDTLRRYIVRRYNVNAMEMTTSEIMDALRKEESVASSYNNLKQILVLSDFVKFAKVHPLPDENELSMTNAYLFVNETKPIEEVEGSDDNKEEKQVDGNLNLEQKED